MSKLKTGLNVRSADFGSYENFKPLGNLYSKSFFPHFTKKWNLTQNDLKSENDIDSFKIKLKSIIKPKKQKHFNRGSKKGNSLLTQLRVGRSSLNSHGFAIGLAENDQCLCYRSETVSHYLLNCFLYQNERIVLFEKIDKIYPKFSKLPDKRKTDILLSGLNLESEEPDSRNIPIALAVQTFILQTGRL